MDQQKIAEFCGITGANPSVAQAALASANGSLDDALALHFAQQDEEPNSGEDEDYDDPSAGSSSAPSQPTSAQPPVVSSSSGPARTQKAKRPLQMTMDELKKRSEEGDDDSEDDKRQDMFAGGEKSGLAVQNPGQGGGKGADHFKNIMNQARANRDRPNADGEELEEGERSTNFTGRAQTLGGDDAPSEVVEDPLADQRSRPQNLPPITRVLHLWADGISVDDGPLFRFDDPANQGIMAEINRGRAPLALLDVQPDQPVDLKLEPHKDENYVAPKKSYKPFGGQGQRLGSPTPALTGASTTITSQPAATSASQAGGPAKVEVDESQPIIQLQIRLGDGTRLQSRFNATHTIGDVYSFVDSASPASTQRPYALMTTFPSKELSDRGLVLGEMSDFKRGGVVVQKWK